MLPNQLKLYVEIAAVLIAAGLFAWFVHVQREQGRNEIRAAVEAARAAQIIHKVEVEARAKALADESLARYKNSLRAPVPRDALAVRVCNTPKQAAIGVRTDVGAGPDPYGAGGLSSAVEGRDIGPVTEQILERANAKVRVLQEYIRNCQQQGICE